MTLKRLPRIAKKEHKTSQLSWPPKRHYSLTQTHTKRTNPNQYLTRIRHLTEHPDLPSPSPNHQHLTSAIVRRPCNIVRGISCTSMTEPCSTQKLIPEFTSRSSMLPWRICCFSWRPVPLCAATQDSPVDGDYYYYLLWDSTQPLCSAGRRRIQRESRMLVVTETCGDEVVVDDVFRRRKLSLMKIWSPATMLLLFESCCWYPLTRINPAQQELCKANSFSENRFSFHLVFVGRKLCSSFWDIPVEKKVHTKDVK